MAAAVERLRREATRLVRNPFVGERRMIVHACHHKVGTAWFKRILRTVSATYGLRYYAGAQDGMRRRVDVFVQDKSRIDLGALPTFAGSHMIRDPRDMIVSGYFYHLWTPERWAHVPEEQYGGRSFQEHLNSLSQTDGLLAQIERFAVGADLRDMLGWQYGHPDVVELRYEDVIADEERAFGRLFRHYGFTPEAAERCLGITRHFSFAHQKQLEGDRVTSHLRSGRPGEWREVFEPPHVELCKERIGDALIRLGYESDLAW